MRKIWEFIKREFLEVLPGWIFFFTAAVLLQTTRTLILREYGIHFLGYARALVVSLLYAKILLVVDHCKWINRYSGQPLIYSTVWKTLIYYFCGLILQYLEPLVMSLYHGAGFVEASGEFWRTLVWERFVNSQMWILLVLFVFAAFRELIRFIGSHKLRDIFFGPKSRTL